MSVKLRENVKKNGVRSLYLDIYIDGVRSKEYLGINLKPARTPEQRNENKELEKLANQIRIKKEMELLSRQFQLVPDHKKERDFISFYKREAEEYSNKDKRLMNNSLTWFLKFTEERNIKTLKFRELTEDFCRMYVDYMKAGGLRGETPYNYYTKFKKVVKRAMEQGHILKNPAENVRVKRADGLKKDILSAREIQALANTPCRNNDVKRAFLFSCKTGIRWVDVMELQQKNVDRANMKLKFQQSKTGAEVIQDIRPDTLKLIGEPKAPGLPLFDLPSFSGALKIIQDWTIKAGIYKRITWHSARHSFAVNLLTDSRADIKTVSNLLGHTGLKHTEKYLHVVDENKSRAIMNQKPLKL